MSWDRGWRARRAGLLGWTAGCLGLASLVGCGAGATVDADPLTAQVGKGSVLVQQIESRLSDRVLEATKQPREVAQANKLANALMKGDLSKVDPRLLHRFG